MAAKLTIDRGRLSELCRRYGIRKLSLFGSVLRDDFRQDSDVDVLVEFKPNARTGFAVVDMADDLSGLFGGHKADMVNAKYLNRHLRERIMASAELQYAEG
jgi:predicted nucleotidyltransferase